MMNDKEIKQIYDKIGPEPNMSLVEFTREMHDLDDPVKIQEDLAEIELIKARQRSNKIRVDRALDKELN